MKLKVIRVLLVEHKPNQRQSLAKYLSEDYNYQLVTAADRVEAFIRPLLSHMRLPQER